jgi:hypothetical protein
MSNDQNDPGGSDGKGRIPNRPGPAPSAGTVLAQLAQTPTPRVENSGLLVIALSKAQTHLLRNEGETEAPLLETPPPSPEPPIEATDDQEDASTDMVAAVENEFATMAKEQDVPTEEAFFSDPLTIDEEAAKALLAAKSTTDPTDPFADTAMRDDAEVRAIRKQRFEEACDADEASLASQIPWRKGLPPEHPSWATNQLKVETLRPLDTKAAATPPPRPKNLGLGVVAAAPLRVAPTMPPVEARHFSPVPIEAMPERSLANPEDVDMLGEETSRMRSVNELNAIERQRTETSTIRSLAELKKLEEARVARLSEPALQPEAQYAVETPLKKIEESVAAATASQEHPQHTDGNEPSEKESDMATRRRQGIPNQGRPENQRRAPAKSDTQQGLKATTPRPNGDEEAPREELTYPLAGQKGVPAATTDPFLPVASAQPGPQSAPTESIDAARPTAPEAAPAPAHNLEPAPIVPAEAPAPVVQAAAEPPASGAEGAEVTMTPDQPQPPVVAPEPSVIVAQGHIPTMVTDRRQVENDEREARKNEPTLVVAPPPPPVIEHRDADDLTPDGTPDFRNIGRRRLSTRAVFGLGAAFMLLVVMMMGAFWPPSAPTAQLPTPPAQVAQIPAAQAPTPTNGADSAAVGDLAVLKMKKLGSLQGLIVGFRPASEPASMASASEPSSTSAPVVGLASAPASQVVVAVANPPPTEEPAPRELVKKKLQKKKHRDPTVLAAVDPTPKGLGLVAPAVPDAVEVTMVAVSMTDPVLMDPYWGDDLGGEFNTHHHNSNVPHWQKQAHEGHEFCMPHLMGQRGADIQSSSAQP